MILLVACSTAQNVSISGKKTFQTIRSLGVNANPQSWEINPTAVRSVIDQLVDSMGCTSFRLMFDDCDWESVNDNDDPHVYNWHYYDSLYSTPRFAGIWDMMRYLNSKGITDIALSPDGAAPAWMGSTQLSAGKESEYAEMISSMVYYAARKLQPAVSFTTISPINESTCGGGEGVQTTPAQFGELYKEVASHLIADSLTEISIVGPDDCGGWLANVHAMLGNAVTMSKVKYFGQHSYGNTTEKAKELITTIKHSAYPDREAFMTELNEVCKDCDGGVYNKDYNFTAYAAPAYQYILQHLNEGITAVQLWEAYDSRYHHPNRYLTWSMWGVFAINDTTHPDVYTPRPHFSVLKHLYRFVKPGYKRIDVSTTLNNIILSGFSDSATQTLVLTGINNSGKVQQVKGMLQHLPACDALEYYYSDAAHLFVKGKVVNVKGQLFGLSVPPNTVFTLVSYNKTSKK